MAPITPPPQVLTDTQFIASAVDELSRTLCLAPHRPYLIRFTSHTQNMTVAITLAPPRGSCGTWMSERMWEECVVAMKVLRVLGFAMVLVLLVCVFSRGVEWVLF